MTRQRKKKGRRKIEVDESERAYLVITQLDQEQQKMSFKGIKKGILRTPQTIRQKFNMGEITHDAVYEDAERRFKEIEIETKKLSDESKSTSMLSMVCWTTR